MKRIMKQEEALHRMVVMPNAMIGMSRQCRSIFEIKVFNLAIMIEEAIGCGEEVEPVISHELLRGIEAVGSDDGDDFVLSDIIEDLKGMRFYMAGGSVLVFDNLYEDDCGLRFEFSVPLCFLLHMTACAAQQRGES